jgi:hypothetical protein
MINFASAGQGSGLSSCLQLTLLGKGIFAERDRKLKVAP